MPTTRHKDLFRYYGMLDKLEANIGGARTLDQCSGRGLWPARGVYFFREPGEKRSDTGSGPRIVRVGTHALKSGSRATLWKRMAQHKGTPATGGGNHRGSIFRLIVGASLLGRTSSELPTWGRGETAKGEIREAELPMEREVTQQIGQMPFLWLAIDDPAGPESLRDSIERNSIALLSNFDRSVIDPPSNGWLGNNSDRDKVRRSGLWNSIHVDKEDYDPGFLDDLDRLISATGGGS